MTKHNYLQKDYTTNGVENQLKFPFEIELKIEKSDPVMLLSQYVEEKDLTDLYHYLQKYSITLIFPGAFAMKLRME